MTEDITKLLELAEPFSSSSWLQFFVIVLIALRVASFANRTLGELRKSAGDWQKTVAAALSFARAAFHRLNRMVGGDIERKRRPSIQATLLAGDIVLYWGFALALFGYSAVFVLLLVLKRPHELKLWAMTIAATIVFYFFSMFYRNLGAKSFESLVLLYRTHSGDRITVVSMSGAIVCLALAVGVAEYLAWPLLR
ncbi:hypothetical protein [Paraburkholderia bryophila]|uniref:Uncharacterized protein n=1 Tax=Paraburkholderia bryophila TaxID=420952 RepID=A0A329CQN1_9BURK|nr:hypothetical protein [Paraburkholderia bryophila]RAS33145.1 hypothetical protein BX591_10762 [Paraburkholderia bryophila]